ncbi:MAG: GNAT family N-acetyltransferase [Rikenellaceae bacterium]|jgi:GNAT superfamily N-acetyltransferase|nr:GNAT family N-acetyltransferase [Bacteroidales bacterium]
MEVVIREATINDHLVIVDFQMAMALETEGLKLERNVLSDGVKAVLTKDRGAKYYIAEMDGVIVAMLMITLEWSDWRNSWVWWIQSVYTKPGFRGKGIFKKLYSHIVDLVERAEDVVGIRLYVDKRNLNAQKVYTSLGMNGDHYTTYEWMKK